VEPTFLSFKPCRRVLPQDRDIAAHELDEVLYRATCALPLPHLFFTHVHNATGRSPQAAAMCRWQPCIRRVSGEDRRHRHRCGLRRSQCRVGPISTVPLITVRVGFARPRNVDYPGAIRSLHRKRWRLGANRFGLLRVPEASIGTVHPTGTVHVGEQLAVLVRLCCGRIDNGKPLLDLLVALAVELAYDGRGPNL
jgi:hypothetical protein